MENGEQSMRVQRIKDSTNLLSYLLMNKVNFILLSGQKET